MEVKASVVYFVATSIANQSALVVFAPPICHDLVRDKNMPQHTDRSFGHCSPFKMWMIVVGNLVDGYCSHLFYPFIYFTYHFISAFFLFLKHSTTENKNISSHCAVYSSTINVTYIHINICIYTE